MRKFCKEEKDFKQFLKLKFLSHKSKTRLKFSQNLISWYSIFKFKSTDFFETHSDILGFEDTFSTFEDIFSSSELRNQAVQLFCTVPWKTGAAVYHAVLSFIIFYCTL